MAIDILTAAISYQNDLNSLASSAEQARRRIVADLKRAGELEANLGLMLRSREVADIRKSISRQLDDVSINADVKAKQADIAALERRIRAIDPVIDAMLRLKQAQIVEIRRRLQRENVPIKVVPRLDTRRNIRVDDKIPINASIRLTQADIAKAKRRIRAIDPTINASLRVVQKDLQQVRRRIVSGLNPITLTPKIDGRRKLSVDGTLRIPKSNLDAIRRRARQALKNIPLKPDLGKTAAARIRRRIQKELDKLRINPKRPPGVPGLPGGGQDGFGGLGLAAAGVAAGAVAINLGRAVVEGTKLANTVDAITQGFEGLARTRGLDADELLAGIDRASARTLTQLQQLQVGSVALATGIEPLFGNLESVIRDITDVATVYGRSVPDSIDRVVRAIQKQEVELLDELGIVVRAEAARREYAMSIGTTASALTSAQQATAFATATLKALNTTAEASGRIFSSRSADFNNATLAIARLNTQYQALVVEFGKSIDPALTAAVQEVSREMDTLGQLWSYVRGLASQARQTAFGPDRGDIQSIVAGFDPSILQALDEVTRRSQQVFENLSETDFNLFSDLNLAPLITDARTLGLLTQTVHDNLTQIRGRQQADYAAAKAREKVALDTAKTLRDAVVNIPTPPPIKVDIEPIVFSQRDLVAQIQSAFRINAQQASAIQALRDLNPDLFGRIVQTKIDDAFTEIDTSEFKRVLSANLGPEALSQFNDLFESIEKLPPLVPPVVTELNKFDSAMGNIGDSISGAVADLAVGEFRFKSFINSLIRDITRAALRRDSGGGGNLFGNLSRLVEQFSGRFGGGGDTTTIANQTNYVVENYDAEQTLGDRQLRLGPG